jgi:hypothetical protein
MSDLPLDAPPRGRVSRLGLPLSMADFARRGFRLDRPAARAELERHATSFLTGFNIGVRHWRDPHAELAALPAEERGFAYEGAGMHAALRDRLTLGACRALRALLSGPGDGYAHLVAVGYGWAFAPVTTTLRLPLVVPKPSKSGPAQPLFRWLALDGAGFAETYFGGLAALNRRAAGTASPRWAVTMAGCGRALWFAQSADIDGVADVIGGLPPAARTELWAGIGLASSYAGCANADALDRLRAASGSDWPAFGQGALFAISARARSGIVPAHTAAAAAHLFGVDAPTVQRWTDEDSEGLTGSAEIESYGQWRWRLRRRVARL